MRLRPYQIDAVEATFEAWRDEPSVLGVAATGSGKTVCFSHIIARRTGRAIVVAHREELIMQAARTVETISGHRPEIEMADLQCAESGLYPDSTVIATVQTLNSAGRLAKFDPFQFSTLIVDEAHHSAANTYRTVVSHFRQNPDLRVLGVTATPDRGDGQALGQVFGQVAWCYDLLYCIDNGWLVDVDQRVAMVESLDLSRVRTTAGDLNAGDLAKELEKNRVLHETASPLIDATKSGLRTLVFTVSVAQAEALAGILCNYRPSCAAWVCGKTPRDQRRDLLTRFANREYQYLVNVGVLTEGYDDPGIECVAVARPTKSRSLYAQMLGRSCRPLPGLVDDPDMFGSVSMRREAIAQSGKPRCLVLDFAGNAGKHQLVTAADILGGTHSAAVVARATRKIKAGESRNVREALEAAEVEEEKDRKARAIFEAKYKLTKVDPFSIARNGGGNSRWTYMRRYKPCTVKQAALLRRRGYETNELSIADASALIDEIAKREKWRQAQ